MKIIKYMTIWFIGCVLLYVVPSGIGAFVQLDWGCFDFTTWKEQLRVILSYFMVIWTILFLFMKDVGVFD